MVLPLFSFAQELSVIDTIKKVPGFKQGVMYNWQDNRYSYISTIEAAKFKDVSLEIGYSTDESLIGVVSYRVASLKDMGVTMPILDLIEFNVGLAAGAKRIAGGNNEFKCGCSLTLIDVNF
jgi:hypothetical protein